MENDPTSYELLSHFDRPKLMDPDEVEGVAGVERSEPAVSLGAPVGRPQPPITLRGVRWVFLWAAAIGVLVMATSVLAEFAYLFAAERSLNAAARAGAMEATLPRATYQSVTAAVERHLANYPQLNGRLQLRMLQNGRPVGGQFRAGDGDRLSITLTAPTSSLIPGWLQRLSMWRRDAPMNAYAERQAPGRKLRPAQS